MKTVRQQLEDLTPGEAVYGFAGWLTTRDKKTVMSAQDDAAPVASLVNQFVTANELEGPRENWPEELVIPVESKTIKAQFEAKQ